MSAIFVYLYLSTSINYMKTQGLSVKKHMILFSMPFRQVISHATEVKFQFLKLKKKQKKLLITRVNYRQKSMKI